MYTVNDYCRDLFGEKLYKIALNGGMTCPNRDGSLGTGGCIFCSEGGSGDFAPPGDMDIDRQIDEAKKRISGKYHGSRYIAYFQAYTNTYAPVSRLEPLFTHVISRQDTAVLAIATRPDCLGNDMLDLLCRLSRIKPVWVELGLQTIHKRTSDYIRRGYELDIYDKAVKDLISAGIHVITHVILGLPGESSDDMLETVKYVIAQYEKHAIRFPQPNRTAAGGIKLQLLHVLEGTDLADDYRNGLFEVLSLEEYTEIVCRCIKIIPNNTVIHRITGDGPKRLLIAPLWSADKKNVLNTLNKAIRNGNTQNQ
ncbi:MAG: TIGR01212 family radical SAM protein [Lachnospiraceae bacterium]|nr:TIGR01212 family radical SAM protein [Lachnospiraceae bacterium]